MATIDTLEKECVQFSNALTLYFLATHWLPCYGVSMESTPFELTPEQKGMLASLCREAGQPLSTLLAAIADVLEEVQEKERREREHGTSNGHESAAPALEAPETPKPIWDLFEEASLTIPDEELDRLPTDLAAQVDHYVYGLPKR